jgi:hypothetical protein
MGRVAACSATNVTAAQADMTHRYGHDLYAKGYNEQNSSISQRSSSFWIAKQAITFEAHVRKGNVSISFSIGDFAFLSLPHTLLLTYLLGIVDSFAGLTP